VNDNLDEAYAKMRSVLVSWFWQEYETKEQENSIKIKRVF
jgi:hypothetical protein